MKTTAHEFDDLPLGSTVADAGDRYLVVYPGRPWLRIAKDRSTAKVVRAVHLRLVKSDRR